MASPIVESFTGPTFESDAADNALTLTTPAGTVEGELLVAQFGMDDATDTNNMLTPTGWTKILELKHVDANNLAVSGAIFQRFAPASPPATFDFSKSGDQGTVMGGGMLRISGANSTPIDVSGSDEGTSANNTDCPDVITTVADALVLRFFAADDNDYPTADSGYPTSHTGLYADETSLGSDMSVGAAHIDQASAGATGVGKFTGLTPLEEWVAFTVVIAPAVAAAAPFLPFYPKRPDVLLRM